MPVLKTRNGCFHQYWPSEWAGTQPAHAIFHPEQLIIEVFETYFFDIVITQNDHPR